MRAKRRKERQQRDDEQRREEAERRQHFRAIRQTTASIAQALGETETQPQVQIERIILHLGAEQAQSFLEQAQEIEKQGGMMLADNSRRRTVGGVFFLLVKQHLKETEHYEEMKAIFKRIPKNQELSPQQPGETQPIEPAEGEDTPATTEAPAQTTQ